MKASDEERNVEADAVDRDDRSEDSDVRASGRGMLAESEDLEVNHGWARI